MQLLASLPNFLSFLRIPLAIAFLIDNVPLRLLLVLAAWLTDVLDGYLARRYNQMSRFGTLLDPITDKFFVLFVAGVLFFEQKLPLIAILAMLSRDYALILFWLTLVARGAFAHYRIRAFICGKLATGLQFITLLIAIFGEPIPNTLLYLFGALGVGSYIELITLAKRK